MNFNTKKRGLSILLFVCLIHTIFLYNVHADDSKTIISKEFVVLSNGDCLETIIYEENNPQLRSAKTKTGTKTTTYKSNGKSLWYVSVTGTFTYTGSSSKCTASSVKAGSYDQYWKISNKKSSYTANCAIGSATGKLYYGPSPVTTINKEVVLKCNINGTLS